MSKKNTVIVSSAELNRDSIERTRSSAVKMRRLLHAPRFQAPGSGSALAHTDLISIQTAVTISHAEDTVANGQLVSTD